ncbi:hypothetical protein [Phocaeicola vulgatus]|uniref:hypothetical protein n=1 Tax=Phocaeicola vulgatus TaxID=821 RepID=UPI003563B67D
MVSFHRSRFVQLWSEWCLYGVLQEAISWELEDEKVSVTIGKRTMFSIGCFPYCCFWNYAGWELMFEIRTDSKH